MIHHDPNAAVEDRVAGLLALMTVEEKVAQMMQLPAWSNPRAVIERHPVGSFLHIDPATIDDAIDGFRQYWRRFPFRAICAGNRCHLC